MFELLASLELRPEAGLARGTAVVPAEAPLFADHFPLHPTLPGTLALELAAQVAGVLAEQTLSLRLGVDRFAVLGLVRSAKFLRAVPLPARLEIEARVSRSAVSEVLLSVAVRGEGRDTLRGELVMAMIEPGEEHGAARQARRMRLERLTSALREDQEASAGGRGP